MSPEGRNDSDEIRELTALLENAANLSLAPGSEPRRGSGLVFATKFLPDPNSTSVAPLDVFSSRCLVNYSNIERIVHPSDQGKVLIFTYGSCCRPSESEKRAGWGFVSGFGATTGQVLSTCGRLESKGPFGDDYPPTHFRAQIRAVIAALRHRDWVAEGFHTMVIATDTEDIVECATTWVRNWIQDDWKMPNGKGRKRRNKNRDLWEALLGEFERWKDKLAIEFWKIAKEHNELARAAARRGEAKDAVDEWVDVEELLCD